VRKYLSSDAAEEEKKSNVMYHNHYGTCLFVACCQEPPDDIIKTLLDIGGKELVMMTGSNWTVLNRACMTGASYNIIKMLIEVGGEDLVMAKNKSGNTALHYSCGCIKEHTKVAEKIILILQVGDANLLLSAKNFKGETPLEIATDNGASNIIKKLLTVQKVDLENKVEAQGAEISLLAKQKEKGEKDNIYESKSQKDEPDTKRSENTTSDEKFICPICLNVASDVLESSCCGNLYCRECAGSAFKTTNTCPTCRKAHAGLGIPESWQHSTWIERQINEFAPKCACGRNIPKVELLEHGRVCPKLNLPCYKCKATGSLKKTGSTIKCDACQGTKVLLGFEWKKCLKCKGTGTYDTVFHFREHCQPCSGIGALKGKDWTKCTKCCGTGGCDPKEGIVNCSACNSNGVLKGVDWTTCFKCRGTGVYNTAVPPCRSVCQPCEARGQLKGKSWTKCFKCKGIGALNEKSCIACDSNGVLVGVDWTNCAKCEGSGSLAILTSRGVRDVECDACTAMGCLRGLGWVSCTKCAGKGGHATKSGTIVNCSTCNGTAQVKKRFDDAATFTRRTFSLTT
jgi:DnaJ-class molecular chaperone